MVAIFPTSTELFVDGAGVVPRSRMAPRNQQIPMTWSLDTEKLLT